MKDNTCYNIAGLLVNCMTECRPQEPQKYYERILKDMMYSFDCSYDDERLIKEYFSLQLREQLDE